MDYMPFGKWKGTLISEIPTSYIQWGSVNLSGGIQRQFVEELAKREGKPTPVYTQNPDTLFKPSNSSFDCSNRLDPTRGWKERIEWDGTSPPW